MEIGQTYLMPKRGGMTRDEFIERKSQAIASGAVNEWGMTRVGEVWLGDRVIVDCGPHRHYRAEVVELGTTRVRVAYTLKNGREMLRWMSPTNEATGHGRAIAIVRPR
tara:strand:+ start:529 stop:852 length:324 start_codon:yes stop_codon:yes gene_type:complete